MPVLGALGARSADASHGIRRSDRIVEPADRPSGPGTGTNVGNLTNHANLTGFSGVMTSPFFLSPTGVQNPRKVDMGMNISF